MFKIKKCCAYVGIHTVSAHEVPVLKKVRQTIGVKEAFRVYGLYDIMAKLETDNIVNTEKTAEEINGIDFVRGTTTMLIKPEKHFRKRIGSQIPSPVIVAASK